MAFRYALLGFLVLVASTACFSVSVNAMHHQPKDAAAEALVFANLAFVEGNSAAAYARLDEEFSKQITLEQLQLALQQMHPRGRPERVSAIEYEPIPSQPAMNIFLTGEAPGEMFFYRMTMAGTSSKGYKVLGVFRSNGPPPPSDARKPISD